MWIVRKVKEKWYLLPALLIVIGTIPVLFLVNPYGGIPTGLGILIPFLLLMLFAIFMTD